MTKVRYVLLALLALALTTPSQALVIVDDFFPPDGSCAGYISGDSGGDDCNFSFLFPGATASGLAVERLFLIFKFLDDQPGGSPGDETVAINYQDPGAPTGILQGGVTNWGAEAQSPQTFINITIFAADILQGGSSGADLFSWILNGTDDLDIDIDALTDDFILLGARAELYLVPEPSTYLLLGAGLTGLGLLRRRVRR